MARNAKAEDQSDQAESGGEGQTKRSYIKQTDLPNRSLQNALRIAQALNNEFGKRPTRPMLVAKALNISPTSGSWRNLCGASIGYGLTDGGYGADQISLTDLGRSIVAPTDEGMRERGLREAALKPTFADQFLRRYDGSKLPREEIGRNVLVEIGCPADEAAEAVALIQENARFASLLHDIKGEAFVDVSLADRPSTPLARKVEEEGEVSPAHGEGALPVEAGAKGGDGASAAIPPPAGKSNSNVFISHGANRQIVEHVKRVLKLARLTPIVAVEENTTSKPVPTKVLESMRKCSAGVIHVANEEMLFDKDGKECPSLNPNVMIEIGAAMALYGERYVLLVQEGVKLPSNLQGLFRCDYKGDSLDPDSLFRLMDIVGSFN